MNYQDELWAKIYDQYNTGRHEAELAFYKLECTNAKGKCLEIATGTGMILLKLLQEDLDIYGFDLSEQMLKQLSEKAINIGLAETQIRERVSCQNMVSFSYSTKFDLIFIPARSFLHLTNQEDQIKCLQQVRRHLNPNGRFILNFFQPNLKFILMKSVQTENWDHHSSYSFNDGTPNIDLYYRQVNDIPNQIQDIDWKFVLGGQEHLSKMFVRWIYKEEFQLLLRIAGFRKWDLFGGFDRSKYSINSNEMIWEAYA